MLKNLWNTRFSAIHFILSPFEIPKSFSSVSIGSVYRSLSLYSDEDQKKRGGKVKLPSMRMPVSEFGHVEKGDALYGKFFSSLVMFHSLIFSLSTQPLVSVRNFILFNPTAKKKKRMSTKKKESLEITSYHVFLCFPQQWSLHWPWKN